ncbi:MAG: adenosylcobinamide-GDP ribazoletransferase [Desulfobaccales bacterium]
MNWTFPLALTFLTVFPWVRLGQVTPADLARSLFWFPWVGALLGLVFWGAGIALEALFPAPAAAALLLALTVVMTRGLHLDGLADTVDGLGGGRTPEASLAIMKDSRLGAFGALSLVVVLLLKFAFFLALLEHKSEQVLLIFPLVSRWGLVLLAALAPYARPGGGLGQAMTEGATWPRTLWTTVFALALSFLAGGAAGPLFLILAGLVVWGLSYYFRRRLGGVTGDVYGAVNEILETLILGCLVLLGSWQRGIPFFFIFW